MNSKRLRLVLLGTLGVLAIGFTALYFYGMSVLSEKSAKMVELKLESKTAEAQLASLAQAKQEIEQYSYFKEIAKTVIPSDKDQAQAVLDIVRFAKQSRISIRSITFPSSNLGPKPAPANNQQQQQPDSASTPSASASSKTAISQAKPVPDIKGLYSLELTIVPDTGLQVPPSLQVTVPKMLDFLSRIERNRRTAQISQVTIQPQTESNSSDLFSFTLTINIFLKP